MSTKEIVFADELKKDCDILKSKLSLDQDKVDTLYTSTLEDEEKSLPFIKKVITFIVTIVVALLSGLSLLFILIINDVIDSSWTSFIFFFSLIIYLVPAFIFNYLKKPVIASALAIFGLLLMSGSQTSIFAVDNNPALFLFLLFCIIIILIYIFFSSRRIKTVLFIFFFNFLFGLIIRDFFDYSDLLSGLRIMCYTSIIISLLFYTAAFLLEKKLSPVNKRKYLFPLKYNAAFYFYLFFFILTFIKIENLSLPYFVHNILYFIFTTGTLIWYFKRDINIMKQIALVFFCAYIFYKYYDLVWLLLHKSLVLIILGILVSGVATIFAVQWGIIRKHD